MGIHDAQTQLCSAQAFTATAISENTYDSGAAGNDITEGEPLGIGINVTVAAATDDGDETYQFDAVQDSDVALGSPTVLASRVVARASLTAGSRWVLPIPPGSKTERYLGLQLTLGGTTPTITVDAFIAPLSFLGGWKAYADGFSIT
ncbi:MAG: hypothetical protein B7Z62_07880 [Deltaproteobacteria bacterium 37-65-8]|nr:MAG: hypothetical protein B7Z62_07880 [Deltaproteobacteria bacterium 37-65-8]HQT97811.1 hypothetical protein [Thermodesulfobacteriota bacterium]